MNVKNKRLLMSRSSARSKYVAHLEDKKKVKIANVAGRKRKELEDELAELKKKRRAVQSDLEALNKAMICDPMAFVMFMQLKTAGITVIATSLLCASVCLQVNNYFCQ